MATIVRMPKMSDTMQEGVIASWLKKEGDHIQVGDILAEVETDKATMELEAYEGGILLYIGVPKDASVPVNSILAIIGDETTDVSTILKAETSASEVTPVSLSSRDDLSSVQNSFVQKNDGPTSPSKRLKASPLAKKIAKEKGCTLHDIKGTGKDGRIVKRDIDHFLQQDDQFSSFDVQEEKCLTYQEISVSTMRKVIAQRLTQSKQTIPHFTINCTVNMEKVLTMRKEINNSTDQSNKISINDIIVKATAKALQKHPEINATWLGDTIRQYHTAHIGIAVAIEDGLLVPVVRSVEKKTLTKISSEIKAFVQKAKAKQLKSNAWEGATFTISNLGMFGIDSFTAIINPPAACILAIGCIHQLPMVIENQIKIAYCMQLTLSCDHRVVDGSMGALFLKTLQNFLENPMTILV